VLSTLVYAAGEFGRWLIVSGVLRYAFVLSGYLWPRPGDAAVAAMAAKGHLRLQFAVLIIALASIVPAAFVGLIQAQRSIRPRICAVSLR
jgi:hypothetical protein